jgi:uncharacterized protein (TIGR03790 family)
MLWWMLATAHAGLGPDDVLVLYNADDAGSSETASYYAAARDLDDDRLCGVAGLDPLGRALSFEQGQAVVARYRECRDALPHPEDVDVVVLVRGLPYRVDLPNGGYAVSLSALIQIGDAIVVRGAEPLAGQPQARQGSLAYASVENPTYIQGGLYLQDTSASFGASPYYVTSTRLARGEGIPGAFVRVADRRGPFHDFTDDLLIVSRLDGFDQTDARSLVDRALEADASFPTAPFVCMRGAEGARGVRDGECEHAVRMLTAAGVNASWIPAFDANLTGVELVAYFTGTADLRGGIAGQTYVPGAVAENITSFGAVPENFFCNAAGDTCPVSESQTSIARFVRAGATGTHGTVAEPLNNVFPNAGFMLLYSQGYTLGESWLYNQRFVYWVNEYLGDPLVVPFADRPVVDIGATVAANRPLPILADHPWGVATLTVDLDGQRVALGPDDVPPTPESLGLAPGAQVEVFAVAVSGPSPDIDPEGWPNAEPVRFDPGVKGWTRATITIEAPIEAPDPDPDPPDEEQGCGCSHISGGSAGFGLALGVAILSRRRKHQVQEGVRRHHPENRPPTIAGRGPA